MKNTFFKEFFKLKFHNNPKKSKIFWGNQKQSFNPTPRPNRRLLGVVG